MTNKLIIILSALFLILTGITSWRIMLGSVIGLTSTAVEVNPITDPNIILQLVIPVKIKNKADNIMINLLVISDLDFIQVSWLQKELIS